MFAMCLSLATHPASFRYLLASVNLASESCLKINNRKIIEVEIFCQSYRYGTSCAVTDL